MIDTDMLTAKTARLRWLNTIRHGQPGGAGWCLRCRLPYVSEDIVPTRDGDQCRWHAQREQEAAMAVHEQEPHRLKPMVVGKGADPKEGEDFTERRDLTTNRRCDGWRWGSKRADRRQEKRRLATPNQRKNYGRRARNRRKADRDDS